MKIIGIVGKSGSGKTSLSRMLKRNDDIGLIKLDDVSNIRRIKGKMPKGMIEKETYTNAIGEEFLLFSKEMAKILNKVKSNKFLWKLYYLLIDFLKNAGIRKEVNKNISEGRNTIIIERYKIRKFKDI